MKKPLLFISAFLALFILAGSAYATAYGGYQINWWTFNGSGGTSSGGDYSLSGTIGQPDAS